MRVFVGKNNGRFKSSQWPVSTITTGYCGNDPDEGSWIIIPSIISHQSVTSNIPALVAVNDLDSTPAPTGFHEHKRAATVLLRRHTKVFLLLFAETHTSKSSTWWWRCAGTAAWSPRWCPGRSRGPRGRRPAAGASYSDGLQKTRKKKKQDLIYIPDLLQTSSHIFSPYLCSFLLCRISSSRLQSWLQIKSNIEAW